MKPINELTSADLSKIKLIVFDVDGVLVQRGTKIKQIKDKTTYYTKKIAEKQIEQIKKLSELGFLININSGRGLYMLQEMFREILPFVSLTYENGSATWFKGKIYQHTESFDAVHPAMLELQKIKDKAIKGFEPKEFIITLHCKSRVEKIEYTLEQFPALYYIWNNEAYDVGMKELQTKEIGLRNVIKLLGISKENVMAIGDNYNDRGLLAEAGLAISADPKRVLGNFFINQSKKTLPADTLMQQIIKVFKK